MANDAVRDSRPATVLVVEDHDDSRDLLVVMLSDAGYRVAAASTADAALEQLRAGGIDVVITDYNLAGSETGAWLLDAAAREGLLDDAGAILYSAVTELRPPERLSLVVTHEKPVDPSALLDDVARMVTRRSLRGVRVVPALSA